MIDFTKYAPIGKQTGLSVGATAVTLTMPSGPKPRVAEVQVMGAPIRYWTDGSTPTATQGLRLEPYERKGLASYAEVVNFSAIREGSTSATLEVMYYG